MNDETFLSVRGDAHAHVSGALVEEFCPRNSCIDSIIFGCGETVVFKSNIFSNSTQNTRRDALILHEMYPSWQMSLSFSGWDRWLYFRGNSAAVGYIGPLIIRIYLRS